jgi:hypothetical protein
MQSNLANRLGAWALAAVVVAGGNLAGAVAAPAEAQTSATITYFDEPLSPHGRWVDDPDYGRVWVPRDPGPGWRPYAYGRWVYTSDYGWIWVSEEPWGWIVYHYGRWVWTARYGWVWVPGDEWAPAWVEWCYGAGYVGWAPMPPDPYWQGGTYHGAYACTSPPYYSRAVYVRESSFLSARVSVHAIPPSQNAVVARGTVNVTNYGRAGGRVVNRSIDVAKLQAATGVAIRPVRVVQAKGPVAPAASLGAGHELRIYRPKVTVAAPLRPPRDPLKLDTELPPPSPDTLGSGTLPPLDGPSVGSTLPPSPGPTLGGPSLGSGVGSTLGGVRGRLGR